MAPKLTRSEFQAHGFDKIFCRFCAIRIDPDNAVQCSKCTSKFHHECAEKTPSSVNGVFVICCQSDVDPKTLSQETIIVLSTLNSLAAQFGTMRNEFQGVRSDLSL